MPEITVLVLVGSVRTESVNRKLAQLAARSGPEGASMEVYESLEHLPLYNEDIDGASPPEPAVNLRRAVAGADALLLVSPPHNGSITAALKNAIDWLSRPRDASALRGKPVAVIGAAAGSESFLMSVQEHTRLSLRTAGAIPVDDAPAVALAAGGGALW